MPGPLVVDTQASPDAVTSMLATDQFKELFQSRLTKWITWSREGPTHAMGKIPYLRSKNLSVFRFHVHLEAAGTGSHGTVTVESTYFFLRNRWIIYALGLLLFCVGVLFPIVGFSLLDKRVAEIQADIANTLRSWKPPSSEELS